MLRTIGGDVLLPALVLAIMDAVRAESRERTLARRPVVNRRRLG